MIEKLSVRKVYRNAYRYVVSHLFAFFFLTFFYFLGSLLPKFIGTPFLFVVSPIFTFLFFYFAAGCYFKQQILWDKQIFIASTLRFITAVVLFLIALLITTLFINIALHFIKISFNLGEFINVFLKGSSWLIAKYICIYMLFIIFFLIPSFAFVSEITGKNRSLLMTYAKTRGNILRIALVSLIAVILLVLTMFMMLHANIWVASFVRALIWVFISILYFKMYDFFYNYTIDKAKKLNNITSNS